MEKIIQAKGQDTSISGIFYHRPNQTRKHHPKVLSDRPTRGGLHDKPLQGQKFQEFREKIMNLKRKNPPQENKIKTNQAHQTKAKTYAEVAKLGSSVGQQECVGTSGSQSD